MRGLIFGALVFGFALAHAQEMPTSSPTPPPRVVQLHFAAPPLDGTISLGIYDPAGKLVRVLHREDNFSDFTEGHDALETSWDGTDDTGHRLPPGRYHARGFLVGEEVKVEGVDSFFNDWVTDEKSPHLAHISRISFHDDALYLTATSADGSSGEFRYDAAQEKLSPSTSPAPTPESSVPAFAQAALIEPVATAPGKDGSVWAITHVASGQPTLQVVQAAASAQSDTPILRTLAIEPTAPQPRGIAAVPNDDHIYLLEESAALERVRSLSLLAISNAGAGEAVSDWKVDFDRQIVRHRDFAIVNGKPVVQPNESPAPRAELTQKLMPNPLERDQPGKVTLAVGLDKDGSYLQTADGLPLRTISDTPRLTRVLLTRHGDDVVDAFQDDGSVVEQFRVSHVEQMLAFDGGEFDLK